MYDSRRCDTHARHVKERGLDGEGPTRAIGTQGEVLCRSSNGSRVRAAFQRSLRRRTWRAMAHELLTRLGPPRRGTRDYARAVRSITAEGNFVATSAMWRALGFLESRSFAQGIVALPHLQDLARVARETDRDLVSQLRAVMDAHGYEEPRLRAHAFRTCAPPTGAPTHGALPQPCGIRAAHPDDVPP